jgi:hypothetical protein
LGQSETAERLNSSLCSQSEAPSFRFPTLELWKLIRGNPYFLAHRIDRLDAAEELVEQFAGVTG